MAAIEAATIVAKRNLILTGVMGAGKTTVGRIVARQLGMPFVDTDRVIVTRAGETIPEIFANHGEAAFRALEAAVCAGEAAKRGLVIATGGGAVINPQTREALDEGGLVICLTAGLDALVERTGHNSMRPLAGDRLRMQTLLEARKSIYDSLPHHIDTTGRAPEEVAVEVIALWRQAS